MIARRHHGDGVPGAGVEGLPIVTLAFAQTFVFTMLSTRAVIEPLPLSFL